jgi:hypothetical protein
MQLALTNPQVIYALVGLKILEEGFEYWLGKTDKVEAGSKAELLVSVLKTIFQRGKR